MLETKGIKTFCRFAKEMDADGQQDYANTDTTLNIGDILVATRQLPSQSHTFYQIVSFVPTSNKPRVREIRSNATITVNEITHRQWIVVPARDAFVSVRPVALGVDKDGNYRAKDDVGSSTVLRRYDAAQQYKNEWYD